VLSENRSIPFAIWTGIIVTTFVLAPQSVEAKALNTITGFTCTADGKGDLSKPGGGPEGAQWNVLGDITCAVTLQGVDARPIHWQVQVLLKNRRGFKTVAKLYAVQKAKAPTVLKVVIPARVFASMLRKKRKPKGRKVPVWRVGFRVQATMWGTGGGRPRKSSRMFTQSFLNRE